MSISMTPDERAATEAFRADLLDQWKANRKVMNDAKESADIDRYNESVEEASRIYRDIKEAEFALDNGVLPF